jgi:hypothetical protein
MLGCEGYTSPQLRGSLQLGKIKNPGANRGYEINRMSMEITLDFLYFLS